MSEIKLLLKNMLSTLKQFIVLIKFKFNYRKIPLLVTGNILLYGRLLFFHRLITGNYQKKPCKNNVFGHIHVIFDELFSFTRI